MDEDIAFTYTYGIERETVERRLSEGQTGVLSLADGGDAYAVPVAYHYEDGTVFFRLGDTPDSEKMAYVAATETATFVVYDVDPTEEARQLDSWSVVVTGTLRPVPDDDPQYDAAAINERFAPIRVFDEDLSTLDLTLYALDVETIAGRATPA